MSRQSERDAELFDSYKRRFHQVLTGKSKSAQLGRVILLYRATYLYELDPEWVRVEIAPMLDWSYDSHRAWQCWHGYVFGGVLRGLLADVMPFYVQEF